MSRLNRYGDSPKLEIWNTGTATVERSFDITDSSNSGYGHVASPDFKYAASVNSDRFVCYDLNSGKPIIDDRLPFTCYPTVFDANRSRILVAGGSKNATSGTVRLYSTLDWSIAKEAEVATGGIQNPVLLRKSNQCLVSGDDRRLHLIKADSLERVHSTTQFGFAGKAIAVTTACFTPDGSTITTADADGNVVVRRAGMSFQD